jgi:hypothetical protein
MSEVMEQSGALATIESKNLAAFFAEPDGIERIVTQIEVDARKIAAGLDISTKQGRDEIASLARTKIARSKTALIAAGKKLTEDWRKQTTAVNNECKVIENRLDALRDEVRAPLTAWENAEKDRVAGHEAAIARLAVHPDNQSLSSDELRAAISARLEPEARNWQEFHQRALKAQEEAIVILRGYLNAAEVREEEARELAILRAAEAERKRLADEHAARERDERIAAEAAARAKAAAEAEAERHRQEAAEAAQRERDKAAAEVLAAERQAREAREMAAQAQARAEASERQREADRVIAERAEAARREEAQRRAEAEKAAAVEAERRRVAAEQAEAEAEAKRRAADKAHRQKINGEALADIAKAIEAAGSGDAAKAIVIAIAKGEVRHVQMEY